MVISAQTTFQHASGRLPCLLLGMTFAGSSYNQGVRVARLALTGYKSITLAASMTCVTIRSTIRSHAVKVVTRGDEHM